jgi:hypothetical protein
MKKATLLALAVLAAAVGVAAPKTHSVSFGKWLPVKWFVGPTEEKTLPMQVRGLYVDARLREFTTGDPHDVTDKVLVVRRAYRVNDSLPDDSRTVPKWKWQRGSWMMVDRASGRVSQLNLPEFDPFYSAASWYRDYVAYCGVSSDAQKLFALVVELGRKKPIVRRELGPAHGYDVPDSECPPPQWQRQPARVTFQPKAAAPLTFDVHGSAAAIDSPAENREPDSKEED